MALRQTIREGSFVDSVSVVPKLLTIYNGDIGAVKSFTVPSNEVWKVNYALIKFSCTSVIGNRRFLIEIEDNNGNLILEIRARATQAENENRIYRSASGISSEATFSGDKMYLSVPGDFYLDSGYTVKISDENLIDSINDQMTVSFQVSRLEV